MVYVIVVVFGLLEASLRIGLLKTAVYEERQYIRRQLTDRPRVLILGDSFSMEGENSLGSRLKAYFADHQTDTINLAKMGEGPSFYLDSLKLHGAAIKPKLILLNYFVGNDLTDTALEQTSRGKIKVAIKHLMSRSFGANVLVNGFYGFFLHHRIAQIQAAPEFRQVGLEKVVNPFLFEVKQEHPDILMQNLLMASPEAERAWEANERYLLEIKRRAEELRSTLIINVFPPDVQVQEGHYAFYQILGIQTDKRFLDGDRPQRRFAAFCAENGLRCHDLLPAMRKATSRTLYLDQDTHWNAEGNRLAFEEITQYLEKSCPEWIVIQPERISRP